MNLSLVENDDLVVDDHVGPWGYPKLDYSYFTFEVCTRPKYIPGSGQRPQDIAAALPDEGSTAYIIDRLFLNKEPRYIVGYRDRPQLRVSICLENILDWISPWELETWEHEDYLDQKKAEEDELLPGILAKEKSKAKKEAKKEAKKQALPFQSREQGIERIQHDRKRKRSFGEDSPRKKKTAVPGRGPGRPPKQPIIRPFSSLSKLPAPSGPGRRNIPEQQLFTSPSALHRRASVGKGLAGNRTHVLDTSSEEDDDDNDDGDDSDMIQAQLQGESLSTSRTDSPDPLQGSGKNNRSWPIFTKNNSPNRSPRHPELNLKHIKNGDINSSRGTNLRHGHASKTSTGTLGQRPLPSELATNRAVAVGSSREALLIYDRLVREKNEKKAYEKSGSSGQTMHAWKKSFPTMKSPFDQPPSTLKSSASASASASALVPATQRVSDQTLPSSPNHHHQQEERGEDEYFVEAILGSKYRKVRGKPVLHYLIKWEGDWDDSWEPATNVGTAAINEYTAKIKQNILNGRGPDDPKSIWTASSNGDPNTKNKRSCGRCHDSNKRCTGGPPCVRCSDAGLRAEQCAGYISKKKLDVDTANRDADEQPKSENGSGKGKEKQVPQEVWSIISDSEDIGDMSDAPSGNGHVNGAVGAA